MKTRRFGANERPVSFDGSRPDTFFPSPSPPGNYTPCCTASAEFLPKTPQQWGTCARARAGSPQFNPSLKIDFHLFFLRCPPLSPLFNSRIINDPSAHHASSYLSGKSSAAFFIVSSALAEKSRSPAHLTSKRPLTPAPVGRDKAYTLRRMKLRSAKLEMPRWCVQATFLACFAISIHTHT